MDYDENGGIVSIEILAASEKVTKPGKGGFDSSRRGEHITHNSVGWQVSKIYDRLDKDTPFLYRPSPEILAYCKRDGIEYKYGEE